MIRIFTALKNAGKWVKAKFDAAFHNFWGERTYIIGGYQDARFDANAAARSEIGRKARDFESNNAICNRLVDLFEQFTVGANGLRVIPDSSDEKWNQRAGASWQTWCKYPDLVSLQYFGCLQSQMARRWFIDGEIFIHKTRGKSDVDGRTYPRLRLYESHRCYTPKDLQQNEGKTVVDGVQIDVIGRPIGYWIKNDVKSENSTDGFALIPASEIIHLFEPERPGMYRGLSFLYPVMNDMHDLDDIQMYEKRAAKSHSKVSTVVENAAGEADPNGLRKVKMSMNSQSSTGSTVQVRNDQYYDVTQGDETRYLKAGEKMMVFQSNRPSVTQQAFWEHLIAKICAGVGISKLLVLPFSMQGTVTRADLDISTIFFRSRSSVLAAVVQQIYEYYMGWAGRFDTTVGKPPADWFKTRIVPPPAPNVDNGRNSAAAIAEYQNGLRTAQDWYAERGEDWREQFRQRAQEKAFALELIQDPKFKGVEVADIINTTGAVPQSEPDSDDTETEDAEARFQLI